MKFFSDFGLCYRPTASQQPGEPASGMEVALVGGDRRTCSNRTKINGSKYWKPALSAISEDGVVSSLENEQRKVQSEKKVPCKTRSTAAKKPRTSRCYDDFNSLSRKTYTSVMVPAFPPTPFLL